MTSCLEQKAIISLYKRTRNIWYRPVTGYENNLTEEKLKNLARQTLYPTKSHQPKNFTRQTLHITRCPDGETSLQPSMVWLRRQGLGLVKSILVQRKVETLQQNLVRRSKIY